MKSFLKYIVFLGFSLLFWSTAASPCADYDSEEFATKTDFICETEQKETAYESFHNLSARTISASTLNRPQQASVNINFYKKNQTANFLGIKYESKTLSAILRKNVQHQNLISSERHKKKYYIYALRKILI